MIIPTKDCACVSCGQVPLRDLVGGSYAGVPGGLYAGSNERPAPLDAQILAAMATVAPLTTGKIDGVVIGDDLANSIARGTTQVPEWAAAVKPSVRMANCANAAQHLENWSCTSGVAPGDGTWTNGVVAKLASLGLSATGVQFAFFAAMASLAPYFAITDPAARIEYTRSRAVKVLQKAKQYLPNVKVVFIFGGHQYLGYFGGEPFGYDGDFGWQRAILGQDASMALSCWGNHCWADGTTPRSDGLSYPCSDFGSGGHLIDGIGSKHVVKAVVLPWLQTDPAAAALRR